jgi:poly(A) polymerase
MVDLDPDQQRTFALEVVEKLRAQGHESYWAGGCVRDQLLGRTPKDYDVATSARPEEIRAIFGQRRTIAVGAAFGVITVLGPKAAGQIEVATFRQDVSYTDGRRPNQVRFSSSREDALRRDFTINGMFYDPLQEQMIDFVGGQDDLQNHLIRAIGDPRERFTEDKLRLLRAVRFAAAFEFSLEIETAAAIRQMAPEITVVSAERITAEMRAMLEGPARVRAVELLDQTGLLHVIFPEVVVWHGQTSLPVDASNNDTWQQTLAVLSALDQPTFALALAALLHAVPTTDAAESVSRRWKLSNKDADRLAWLIEHHSSLQGAPQQPWSQLQPLLIHDGRNELLALHEAKTRIGIGAQADVDFCRAKLTLLPEQLDPPPLITGEDLIELGLPQGKAYARLLRAARTAQLDGRISTRAEALALVQLEFKL